MLGERLEHNFITLEHWELRTTVDTSATDIYCRTSYPNGKGVVQRHINIAIFSLNLFVFYYIYRNLFTLTFLNFQNTTLKLLCDQCNKG